MYQPNCTERVDILLYVIDHLEKKMWQSNTQETVH